jgi:hypothetical protein
VKTKEEVLIMKRSHVFLAGLGLAVALLAVPAFAGVPDAAPQTMTGCINSKHKLVKVALGDNPSSPCAGSETKVTVAGGDITSVTAGTGLSGGGTSGDVTLASNIHVVTGAGASVPNGTVGVAIAFCADNEVGIGGGWRWDVSGANEFAILSGPSARQDGSIGGWRVDAQNNSGATRTLIPFVTCMKA